MKVSRDFWQSSGYHLLDRDQQGMLVVTDEFLKAYLARPEIAPPADACPAERNLHATLLRDPKRAVEPGQIEILADADARENWELFVQLRDHLLRHETIEAAYIDIARNRKRFPHLFINQLVHLILRNALEECTDPFVLRAAELFFRPQKLTVHNESLIAADEETISGLNTGPVSPLVSMLGLHTATIDVLSEENCSAYWERSDRFDMALDLTAGRRGLSALGDVIAHWVMHLLGITVTVEALNEMRDVVFSWYVGLDAEGTRVGDALWNGEEPDDELRSQTVGLFRLIFRECEIVPTKLRGEPIYLIAAMNSDSILRLKPQNLIAGLPLHCREEIT
jgi:hypothetical protein